MRFSVVAATTALLLAAGPALADQVFARSGLSHASQGNERGGWTPPAGMQEAPAPAPAPAPEADKPKPKPKSKRGVHLLDVRDDELYQLLARSGLSHASQGNERGGWTPPAGMQEAPAPAPAPEPEPKPKPQSKRWMTSRDYEFS